jgi:hypothetical protein
MARERRLFRPIEHAGHAAGRGTIALIDDDDKGSMVGFAGGEQATADPLKMTSGQPQQATCDIASPVAAVMLHLRACYVSKAAILTIPVRAVPVENRSPA